MCSIEGIIADRAQLSPNRSFRCSCVITSYSIHYTKLYEINGVYNRHENPVLTRDHIPLHWRYDLNKETNPYFMERIGFNAAFNAGAIKFNDKYVLVVRVEGNDRKSFFV